METKIVSTALLRTLVIAQVIIVIMIGVVSTGVSISYYRVNSSRHYYDLCKKTQLVSKVYIDSMESQRILFNDLYDRDQITFEQHKFYISALKNNTKELLGEIPCGPKP